MRDSFFGTVRRNDAHISGRLVFWNLAGMDKKHGLGTSWHFDPMSLAKATKFIGTTILPLGAFAAVAEFAIFCNLPSVRVEGIAVECKMFVSEEAFKGNEGLGGRGGGGNVNGLVGTSTMVVDRYALFWMLGFGRHGRIGASEGLLGSGESSRSRSFGAFLETNAFGCTCTRMASASFSSRSSAVFECGSGVNVGCSGGCGRFRHPQRWRRMTGGDWHNWVEWRNGCRFGNGWWSGRQSGQDWYSGRRGGREG